MNTEQRIDPPQWAEWRGMKLDQDLKWQAVTPAAQKPQEAGLNMANGAMRVPGAHNG